MALDTRAAESLARFFDKDCDPVKDAQLAASAVWHASTMTGPLNEAALRLRAGASRRNENVHGWVADLQAFVLARHGRVWVSLMQMFGSNEAVEQKMRGYLMDFLPAFSQHLDGMVAGTFHATPGNDDVFAWGGALGMFGEIWVQGDDQGVPAPKRMEALWLAV